MFARRQYFYFPLLLLASAILLLKSGVYARLLRVEEFGGLSAALLVINTAVSFGALGFNHLAHKVLPPMHAAGDARGRASFLGASLLVFIALAGTAGFSACIAGFFLPGLSLGWILATTAAAITQFLFALQLIGIKSGFRFVDHAAWSLVRAVCLTAAGAVVAWATERAQFVVLAEAVVSAMLLWPMRSLLRGSAGGSRQRLCDAFVSMREHFPAALRLLQLQGMITVIYMLDRWIGVSVLSAREFGIYSVALIVLVAFENLQAIIGVPAYPVLSSLISKDDHAAGYRYAFRISARLLAVGMLLSVPGTFLIDFLIGRFLPQYIEAEAVIHLVLLAGILRVSNFFGTFCILADQEQIMSRIAIGIAATVVALAFLGYLLGVAFTPLHIAAAALAISGVSLSADFLVARRVALRGRSQVPQ